MVKLNLVVKQRVAYKVTTKRKHSDVVADSLSDKENWQDDSQVINSVMSHSMVVALSNNKAVENISRELPSNNKVFELYRDKINHYSAVAPESDWGLFCAVM